MQVGCETKAKAVKSAVGIYMLVAKQRQKGYKVLSVYAGWS